MYFILQNILFGLATLLTAQWPHMAGGHCCDNTKLDVVPQAGVARFCVNSRERMSGISLSYSQHNVGYRVGVQKALVIDSKLQNGFKDLETEIQHQIISVPSLPILDSQAKEDVGVYLLRLLSWGLFRAIATMARRLAQLLC